MTDVVSERTSGNGRERQAATRAFPEDLISSRGR